MVEIRFEAVFDENFDVSVSKVQYGSVGRKSGRKKFKLREYINYFFKLANKLRVYQKQMTEDYFF